MRGGNAWVFFYCSKFHFISGSVQGVLSWWRQEHYHFNEPPPLSSLWLPFAHGKSDGQLLSLSLKVAFLGSKIRSNTPPHCFTGSLIKLIPLIGIPGH